MTRRTPTQKRSRLRVNRILLAAEQELLESGRVDSLSTTKVSKRAGIPVSSVYRYFADRWSLVDALIAREVNTMDEQLGDALKNAGYVSIDSLLWLFVQKHYDYFTGNPRAVILWFDARQSDVVRNRVAGHYQYIGDWLVSHVTSAGLAEGLPEWGGEALVWTLDRTFELMFKRGRPVKEREAIMREGVEMLSTHLRKYATRAGIVGIPTQEFLQLAGPYTPEAESRE
ncbi:MAG: TetR/AcrR family transcriptional regulator [Solirubrobacterales bacterium]